MWQCADKQNNMNPTHIISKTDVFSKKQPQCRSMIFFSMRSLDHFWSHEKYENTSSTNHLIWAIIYVRNRNCLIMMIRGLEKSLRDKAFQHPIRLFPWSMLKTFKSSTFIMEKKMYIPLNGLYRQKGQVLWNYRWNAPGLYATARWHMTPAVILRHMFDKTKKRP